jgi:hypothetical protein
MGRTRYVIVHVCKEPEGGGSIRRAWEYPLAVELSEKPPALTFDATKLTPEQRASVAKLYAEANAMESRGVGEIWRPTDGGPRPAALYVRGLYSMESGPDELEALHAANPRAKNPVAHIVFSLDEEESKVVSPEQLIRAAERAMDYAGFADHAMLIGVHADQDNLHCHVIASTINPTTLRVTPKHGRIGRLHRGARVAEKDFGMKADFGLWHTRSDGEIVPTLRPDWEAYNREYKQGTSRSEELAKTFVDDNEGLESAEDRCDRVVYALREYLEHCAERGEVPLRSDFHRLAAQLTCTLENAKDGRVVVRLMERAAPGTARSRRTDAIGEVHEEIATWTPTTTAFAIEPSELAVEEIAGQKKTVPPPAWLRGIGNLETAATEVEELLERDPSRISRDLIAGGQATFSLDDFDRWTAERMSFGWLEVSDAARKADETIRVLSADTTLDLLTTHKQLELEQRVFARATRLSRTSDPGFDRAALQRAIADEEKARGITFSEQQRAAFALFEYRFGLLQGDAGVGKSTLLSVARRYCELTGREIAGFTTSQRAAAVLGEQSGIRSLNTARAQALESTRGEEMIRPGSYAVLDEVSMVSFEAVDAFLARVEKQGAGALAIGDAAQLPNIGAGDTMRVLRRAVGERFAEVTQVFRQQDAVKWMRAAVPRGGKAIRDGDADAFVSYVHEYAEHGVMVYHDDRKSEVAGKAADIVEATQRGVRVMAPARDRTEAYFVNGAVRRELGLEGTGLRFTFRRGAREIAAGDRIQFERNDEKRVGVLNGWTGTVLEVAPRKILVELDGGNRVAFDPLRYRHVDWGWAVTTHKSQGSGDPLVIATIAKSDDPHSLHTALTRCEQGLRVHTRLTSEQIDEQMRTKLVPKRDALLFHEMVEAVGGPDSVWARTVRRAMESDRDPLHQEWRTEMHERAQALRDRLDEIFHDVTLSDRQRGIARVHAARENTQTPFGTWAWQHRHEIEQRATREELRLAQRDQHEAVKRAVEEIRRAAAIEPEVPEQRKSRGRSR